jgi:hypothetical protein
VDAGERCCHLRTYAEPLNHATRGDELWLIPLDGGPPRRLDVDLGAAVPGQLGKIRLSPDGKRLAYVVGKFYQTETLADREFSAAGRATQRSTWC